MKPAVLTLLMLVLAPAASPAVRHGYDMEIPAAGVRTIAFDVQEGDLVIRGDATATAVRMHVAIDRYWLFRLGETDILKRLIKVTGEGTLELKIVTNIEPSWRNYGRAEYPIDFEVVVPAGAALNIADTSGKIEISGINNGVVVHDESGTLAVRNVKGALDVDKKSGDVRVQDVTGAINVVSASGQLQFQRVGDLTVSSSDGNLTVTDAGSVRLVNKGGNIRVSGIRGSVHIDDDSGEIEVSQVSGDVNIRDTSGQIRVSQVGALTVNDTSGDVVVDGARRVNIESKESGQVKLRNVAGDAQVPPGITLSRR